MLIAAAHAHRRCSSIAVFGPDRRPSSASLISGAPLLHTNLRFQPSRPPVSAYRPPISADFTLISLRFQSIPLRCSRPPDHLQSHLFSLLPARRLHPVQRVYPVQHLHPVQRLLPPSSDFTENSNLQWKPYLGLIIKSDTPTLGQLVSYFIFTYEFSRYILEKWFEFLVAG
ncbi:hypothetical protein LXL04_008594 [Taraxacum kok-saghyz]